MVENIDRGLFFHGWNDADLRGKARQILELAVIRRGLFQHTDANYIRNLAHIRSHIIRKGFSIAGQHRVTQSRREHGVSTANIVVYPWVRAGLRQQTIWDNKGEGK